MEEHENEIGPIDILVIGFPAGAPMSGEAVPLLLDLVDRRVIRVLDVMFVVKERDGGFRGFEGRDLGERGFAAFSEFEGASSGLLGDQDVATAAEALEPGSAAVMLVYENRWAAPFATAVRRNGGVLLANQRIPVEELASALDAVDVTA